ncbi:glycerophosphodiester phosphodiesterase [Devosia sp.]|uniref:glycerophosphodiester phosphodiesterase n=1 Tax=Devosia sp. TaxID=1871048 RepID=UPI003F703E15
MLAATWTSFSPSTHGSWIVAHRGASARHRESSAEAFEDAIADGANAVETDVRRSQDGVFVCHHDETLKRTAGLDTALSALPFDELQRVAPDYAVRLEDVLERVRGRCNILLDLKLTDVADIRSLVGLLASHRADDSIAIGVRSLEIQAQIRQLNPDLVQLALLGTTDHVPRFVTAGGAWVRLWERDATEAQIEATRVLGVPVLVMVGGPGTDRAIGDIGTTQAGVLLERGGAGLMLNDPRIARPAPPELGSR